MNRKSLFVGVLLAGFVGCGGSGAWSSGDRVLVAKCLYDTHAAEPRRYDVVVFKYPLTPVEKGTPKNYIKRLMGLPGEILAIFFGRVYHYGPQEGQETPYRKEDEGADPNRLWQRTHDNDPFAQNLFNEGQFRILRKPPDVLLALRRIVFDNDFPPKDLEGMVPPRWNPQPTKGWRPDSGRGYLHKGDAADVDWLRYQHLVVERSAEKPAAGGRDVKPQLITDRMGYNSFTLEHSGDQTPYPNWVGDLMLECDVEVQKTQGELWFELSKGIYRFQARFNLADGVCTLVRIDRKGREETLESKPTRLKGAGGYAIRFANVDARLIVWVDRELPFGDGHDYPPPEVRAAGEKITDDQLLERRGPTENDLQPASIGSKGAAVAVKHLRLWRDTYYTTDPRGPDYAPRGHLGRPEDIMPREAWSDPRRWEPLQKQSFRTIYVQPGHYLCLGDNSTASSDSRDWGLVPQRLMLGRALAVYWPTYRMGPIK